MEEPAVSFDGAVHCLELCNMGICCPYQDIDEPIQPESVRLDVVATMIDPARNHFEQAFKNLLSIPEDDTAALKGFFNEDNSVLTTYEILVPKEAAWRVPLLDPMRVLETYDDQEMFIPIGLQWQNVEMNNAAVLAIKKRLLAVSSPYFLLQV
eukprot:3193865-Rhodomonas_salina.1